MKIEILAKAGFGPWTWSWQRGSVTNVVFELIRVAGSAIGIIIEFHIIIGQ